MAGLDDLQGMLDALTMPAYIVAANSRCILASNIQFQSLLGYSAHALKEMSIDDLSPAEDIPLLDRALVEAAPEGAMKRKYVRKDLSVIYARLKYREMELLVKDRRQATRFVTITAWDELPAQSASAQ